MRRLRLGVVLIVISWLPFAQVFLAIAHSNGNYTSSEASNKIRAVIWSLQILVGLVGVWLVGKLAVKVAKKDGWRKTPSNLWHLFRYGPAEE